MLLVILPLPFVLLGLIAPRSVGRAVAAAGSLVMSGVVMSTILVLREPNSDTSVHKSNWDSHGGHSLFESIVVAQILLALLLAACDSEAVFYRDSFDPVDLERRDVLRDRHAGARSQQLNDRSTI